VPVNKRDGQSWKTVQPRRTDLGKIWKFSDNKLPKSSKKNKNFLDNVALTGILVRLWRRTRITTKEEKIRQVGYTHLPICEIM